MLNVLLGNGDNMSVIDPAWYKVHYILDNKVIFNNLYPFIPRIGELVRIDDTNQCYIVKEIVHCLDETHSKSRSNKIYRVNISIEKE